MVGRGNCFVRYSEEGESVDEQIAGLAEDLQSTSQPLEQMTIKTFPKKTFPKKTFPKKTLPKKTFPKKTFPVENPNVVQHSLGMKNGSHEKFAPTATHSVSEPKFIPMSPSLPCHSTFPSGK